jgi:hypothetical protein
MLEVWTYSQEMCVSPCLWLVQWGCARLGAMSQTTPQYEPLWNTRISRQVVPRLPPAEGYVGTLGQGRHFLSGCRKTFPTHETALWTQSFLTATHHPRGVVLSVAPWTNVSTQTEVSTGAEELPTTAVAAEKLQACRLLISDSPAVEKIARPQNYSFYGPVHAQEKGYATRSLYLRAASPPSPENCTSQTGTYTSRDELRVWLKRSPVKAP